MKDNKRGKIICIFFIILSFLLASTLIGVGIHFNIITSNNYIMGVALDKTKALLDNYFVNNSHQIMNNFSLNSKIDAKLESEKYSSKSIVDLEALKRVNYLKNLSEMNTELTLKQDTKNNKLFFEIDEKILDEEIVNYKYLIDNSTKYYFLDNFLSNYVNDGSCNYFESFDSDSTLESNVFYLYDFITESLKSNLKKDYFKRYDVSENINGKEERVKQISLRVNDTVAREILNNILMDLKNDEKAKKILTSIYKDFSKWKVKDNFELLHKNESYTINIYTTNVMCKFLKMEIIYLNGDDKKIVTYEGDETKGEVYYIEGDKVKYIINCAFNSNKYVLQVRDELNNKLGEFSLEFDKERTNIIFNFNDKKRKMDFIYTSKYLNGSDSKKKTNDTSISFKFLENKVSNLSGDLHIVSEIVNDVEIDEDVSSSILKATLNDENRYVLDSKRDIVKARLER